MNPVPFMLRFVAGWPSIRSQVDVWAIDHQRPSYTQSPTRYRFDGWGVVVKPQPRLACNVSYFANDGIIDLGRFVA